MVEFCFNSERAKLCCFSLRNKGSFPRLFSSLAVLAYLCFLSCRDPRYACIRHQSVHMYLWVLVGLVRQHRATSVDE